MELQFNKKPVVLIAGSVTTVSGYGSRARDIARVLIKSNKYDVRIMPLKWGETPETALSSDNEDDKIILERLERGNITYKPDIFIHITIPNEFATIGKYNIGITAGIETTICNPEWIVGCNRMDLVLVSSKHSADVFKNISFDKRDNNTNAIIERLQLKKPVEVLFEGVNVDVFNNKPDTALEIVKRLDEIPESFCFLFVGHWLQGELGHDRKDVGMLIKTFIDTFKNKQRKNQPALILKTSQAGFSITEYQMIYNKIQDIIGNFNIKNYPPIYVIEGQLSDMEMNAIYNHKKIKAMVSFTKGEGFGRPLIEFAAIGKPVIASGWSGQLDYLNPEHHVLLPGSLNKVHPSAVNNWIVEGSEWFTVNYSIASSRLRDVYSKYNEYKKRAYTYRNEICSNFSLDAMGTKLMEYIDNINKYKNNEITPKMTKLKLPTLTNVTN